MVVCQGYWLLVLGMEVSVVTQPALGFAVMWLHICSILYILLLITASILRKPDFGLRFEVFRVWWYLRLGFSAL